MKIINLLRHAVTVVDMEGNEVLSLDEIKKPKKEEKELLELSRRVKTKMTPGKSLGKIKMLDASNELDERFPKPKKDVYYLVDKGTVMVCQNRSDLICVGSPASVIGINTPNTFINLIRYSQ